MERPAKPRPDFPLLAHATGRWAKKIKGKLHDFGPWNDPEGAERGYGDYATNQCIRPGRAGKAGKDAETPRKPRKNFPLWPHPTGPWAKKINGTTYYFGRWGDPDGAEEKYKLERDDLVAGRIPRDRQPGGRTIQALCDKFLEQPLMPRSVP